MKRVKLTAFGPEEALVEAVRLVGRSGAQSFEVVWTHPDYPLDSDVEPPAGVDVTWSVGATYVLKRRGRRPVSLVRAAAALSRDGMHADALIAACVALLRDLGANVTTLGDQLRAEPVPVPDEARRHLEGCRA